MKPTDPVAPPTAERGSFLLTFTRRRLNPHYQPARKYSTIADLAALILLVLFLATIAMLLYRHYHL